MAENNDDLDVFTLINEPPQDDRDLAAMLFDETSPPSPEATQTVAGEETRAPEKAAAEAPPKPGLLARLKGMFRRAPAETPEEEAAPAPEAAAAEEGEEAPAVPRSRKKLLLVALAALVLLGTGIGGTVLALRHTQAEKEAELRKRQAELAVQKAQLEKQKAELAAQKAQSEKAAREAAANAAPQQGGAAVAVGPEEGDVNCAVVGKEEAAETVKRCIEAYNRATGRTK